MACDWCLAVDWLDRLEAGGMWTCCRHQVDYPPGLRDAADSPDLLTGRGERALLLRLEPATCVTVVGARRASSYGIGVAYELSRQLAGAGLTVLSGMANGIDAAAHRGALDGGGLTAAVLAGGPDRPYPRGQAGLYSRIVESGLILSESPPGKRPERWAFPARNRIMAAIARMTVVVEAAESSGSLITARLATDLGREVGAVPGPITAASSAGANKLLRDGAAVVTRIEDVLDAILGPGQADPAAGPPLDPAATELLHLVESGLQTPDAIAAASSGSAPAIASILTRLELLGYIRVEPGGRYARTLLAAPA